MEQAELALQAVGAGVGDVDGAAAVGAPEPAELEQAVGERAAERAGEVVGLLGPVDAVAQRGVGGGLDAEPRELARARAREAVVDVAAGRGQPVLARRREWCRPSPPTTAPSAISACMSATPSRPARWS